MTEHDPIHSLRAAARDLISAGRNVLDAVEATIDDDALGDRLSALGVDAATIVERVATEGEVLVDTAIRLISDAGLGRFVDGLVSHGQAGEADPAADDTSPTIAIPIIDERRPAAATEPGSGSIPIVDERDRERTESGDRRD